MLERVGARASRRCPASTRVRGAPGSSQHAKCCLRTASVGPASEQVELSASPCRLAASPTRLSALADGALRSRHETSGSGAPALLSAAASTTRSRLESGPERLPWVRRHDHDSGVADAPRARAACAQPQRSLPARPQRGSYDLRLAFVAPVCWRGGRPPFVCSGWWCWWGG